MSKPTYLVTVVHLGREVDYYDFWELGLDRGRAGDLLTADIVSFDEPVRASNKREAYVLVRSKYPDHHVINKAVKA
jgi:hypothetical protein